MFFSTNRQTESLFELYAEGKPPMISFNNLKLILEQLGLIENINLFSEGSDINQDNFGSILNSLALETEKFNQMASLFNAYSSDGKIDRCNLKLMLKNHLSDYSPEEIEDLLDDFFKNGEFIDFDEFKNTRIF